MKSRVSQALTQGPFSQQDLPAYQPLLTPVVVTGTLLFMSVLFTIIGIVLLERSDANVYQRERYDNLDGCTVNPKDDYNVLPGNCTLTFTLKNDMDAPVYFYYEVEEFYQNQLKYSKSKSDAQLRGDSNPDVSTCKPMKTYQSDTLNPCGLIARSFFSDRFAMAVNGEQLCNRTSACVDYGVNNSAAWNDGWAKWRDHPNWSTKGIVWRSDLDEKFSDKGFKENKETKEGQWQNLQGLNMPANDDKDFIIWMRLAALPNFRKLHRIIHKKDLKKGDQISILIKTWFPVSKFKGKKYISLATTTWAGLENYALAWALIIMAITGIVLALVFGILLLFRTRKLAEVHKFKWHNCPRDAALVSIAY